MKKILHLITGLEVGGAENMLLKVLPLTREAAEHHVCSIIGAGPIGDQLQEEGVPVHYLDLSYFFDFTIIPRLRGLIRQLKPQAMITYLPHADLLGRVIGRLERVPVIACSARVNLTKSKYLPMFILDGLSTGMVDQYHCNSKTVASLYHRYFGLQEKKITVIPNTIDLKRFSHPVDEVEVKHRLGLPLNKIIIGCVARLRRQKGHRYLITAFAKVHRVYPETILLLIGDGEQKNQLVRQTNRQKLQSHVRMLGNRHDVPEILKVIDIFALTTLYEGMSNSLMEAMAASLPIVTTNIPENCELIKHNQTGLLVPLRASSRTAQMIIRLINNPEERVQLGKSALSYVGEHHDLNVVIPQYKQFYERLTAIKND